MLMNEIEIKLMFLLQLSDQIRALECIYMALER